ncbi:hypothetical protein HPB51_006333 [Rhipicephalus microplus]|uniref:Transposable element P transposase-like RNase H C-terminal domain-containing protein n=1 Tax=Rhipicephalus microplus TaxID=6941 RepID=A0A9J6D8M7_RHIMP|nr:hypothetical protein HPB51_006333 [Rhipicephalus microplus]
MRMKSLIAVVTARHTAEALGPNSASEKSIKEMLSFLDAWERHADKKFLSESSAEGLEVTLTSTLELLRYLREKYGFRYLLTSRLSQDKVENFFGIARLSSGCNSHPTPQQLTVHCLSFYNLAHSVAGGNAEGDVISSLLDVGDREETPKQQLIDQMKLCAEKQAGLSGSCESEAVEHEYHIQRSDSRLTYYISGYVARKCVLPTKCSACNDSLLLPTEEGRRLHAAKFVRHNDQDGSCCALQQLPSKRCIILGSQPAQISVHPCTCAHLQTSLSPGLSPTVSLVWWGDECLDGVPLACTGRVLHILLAGSLMQDQAPGCCLTRDSRHIG